MTSLTQLQTLLTLEKVCNVLGAVSDISIAGTLVFLLRKSRTGFKRTETLVNRLVMFSINTGLITSMCAIMALVSVRPTFLALLSPTNIDIVFLKVLAWPNTFLYIAFYLLISRRECSPNITVTNPYSFANYSVHKLSTCDVSP